MSDSQEPTDYERKRRDLEQLKACKADLAAAIGAHIDWLLEMEADGHLRSAEDMAREPFGIAEASARARQPIRHAPGTRPSGEFEPEQVSWHDLASLIEHEPEQGRDLWLKIKSAARQELATGVRAAHALESRTPSDRRPWQRARYLAIVDALSVDLQPDHRRHNGQVL